MADDDLKKEFDEAYQNSSEKWWPFWHEAGSDTKMTLNDQWGSEDKTKIKKQEREPMSWNKCRRIVNLLSGYERQNRLSIKLDAIEGADRRTVDQHSGSLQYTWNKCRGYNVISNTFQFGSVMTGLGMIELYMDYTFDPLNGDMRMKRMPYQSFILDPYLTEPDLSDCAYILTRDWLSMAQIKLMAVSMDDIKEKDLKDLQKRGKDHKFPKAPPSKDFKGKNYFRVDRFFRRDTDKATLLYEPTSGRSWDYDGKPGELKEFLASPIPELGKNWGEIVQTHEYQKAVVKMGLLIEGQEFYNGLEPHGLDDYPFTAFMGYFVPEHDDFRKRLCGVVRDMRDPQTDLNHRHMKLNDIMDNMVDFLVVKPGALVNKKQAYQRGSGVLWMKDDEEGRSYEYGKDVNLIQGRGAAPGVLESIQLADKALDEVPGGNETLMGMPSKDDPQEAWMMGKLRMLAGLTIFQPLFDNLETGIADLGVKSLKMILANYPASKIGRILNQPPTKQFYDKDFAQYDVLATQGLQTKSQKQMKFAQLVSLAQMQQFQGKFPLSMILEASDLELATDFIAELKQGEQMQKQIGMVTLKAKLAGDNAELQATIATAELKKAQAQKAIADAAKTMALIKQIPEDQMHKLMEMMIELDKSGGFGMEASALPAGPQAPTNPITTR